MSERPRATPVVYMDDLLQTGSPVAPRGSDERLLWLARILHGDALALTDDGAEEMAVGLARLVQRLRQTNDDRAQWRERAISAEQALGLYVTGETPTRAKA